MNKKIDEMTHPDLLLAHEQEKLGKPKKTAKKKEISYPVCATCRNSIKHGRVMVIRFGEVNPNSGEILLNKEEEVFCPADYRAQLKERVIPTWQALPRGVRVFPDRTCPFCNGTMKHKLDKTPNPITERYSDRSDYYGCVNCGAMETVDGTERTFPVFYGE